MSDLEFIKRLPKRISHKSDGGLVEMYRATADGLYYIETGDPCCEPTMSWESWVAFAREIIAADDAARAGGGV
ncbi:hypothetical protein [Hoeflea olei]|uniref:Uncharacterized protein n=1 Tax=Hoeflea olei TaxID=1480615 RepID=A0A1C1YS56_9HYPH|nr:hypothetical protein [Hoeflea olei]OCW56276.1 hypothetical protein AWJ14_19470 [Hoeflea olei]